MSPRSHHASVAQNGARVYRTTLACPCCQWTVYLLHSAQVATFSQLRREILEHAKTHHPEAFR